MNSTVNQNACELQVSRFIAAPPARVWQIMTERVPEWWCPKPWTTEVRALEWRAGGPFDFVMRGPGGEEEAGHGVLLEVLPERRFVFTDAMDANWQPQDAFMIGLFEISPEGDGTRYTARARHWSQEALARHREMGFEEGWQAVADQLAALAEGK
jgi:uncharacterized protein YndB with AHSA1/START domain